MKSPHCKICGHDHYGLCTECPKCNQSAAKDRAGQKITLPSAADNRVGEIARDPFYILSERVDVLEKRLDSIDKRRKYQREYMRKKRGKK